MGQQSPPLSNSTAQPRGPLGLVERRAALPVLVLFLVVGLAIAGDIWGGKTPVPIAGPVGIGAAILFLLPLATFARLTRRSSEIQATYHQRRRYLLRWYAVYYVALVGLLVAGPLSLVITPR